MSVLCASICKCQPHYRLLPEGEDWEDLIRVSKTSSTPFLRPWKVQPPFSAIVIWVFGQEKLQHPPLVMWEKLQPPLFSPQFPDPPSDNKRPLPNDLPSDALGDSVVDLLHNSVVLPDTRWLLLVTHADCYFTLKGTC